MSGMQLNLQSSQRCTCLAVQEVSELGSAHRKLMTGPSPPSCTYNAPGNDYAGSDLQSAVVSSAASCCYLCQANRKCAGFVYYVQSLPSTPTCYLKYSVAQGLTPGLATVTSGLPY